MPASQKTIAEIIRVLNEWRKEKGLVFSDISELLLELENVEGNKSFRETMTTIRNCW